MLSLIRFSYKAIACLWILIMIFDYCECFFCNLPLSDDVNCLKYCECLKFVRKMFLLMFCFIIILLIAKQFFNSIVSLQIYFMFFILFSSFLSLFNYGEFVSEFFFIFLRVLKTVINYKNILFFFHFSSS